MENIVADENCGQGLVEPVANPKYALSAFISLVGQGAHTHLADGGIGRLGGSEVGVQKQKQHIQYTTGRIHEKTNSLFFNIIRYIIIHNCKKSKSRHFLQKAEREDVLLLLNLWSGIKENDCFLYGFYLTIAL